METVKNSIRYIYFWLCEIGLASPEIAATTGTLKYKALLWLYGQDAAVPMFDMQLPDSEEK